MAYEYGLLFASLASLCWGISPILTKRALSEMGLCKVLIVRGFGLLAMLIPAFFLVSAETAKELLSLSLNSYLILALIALLNNIVGDIFYLAALRYIGVSLTAPITSSYPLVVALASWLWFGEVLTLSVLGGTFSVVAGLTLLNIRSAEERGASGSSHLRGVVLAFLAALCWASGLALNKHLTLGGVSSTAITFWRGIIFSLMAIVFLPLFTRGEKETRAASITGILAAAVGGIVALVIGGWFFVSSLSLIPMNVATPIASSSPLVAALFACAFMGERLRPIQWLGIVCVVGGAVAVGI